MKFMWRVACLGVASLFVVSAGWASDPAPREAKGAGPEKSASAPVAKFTKSRAKLRARKAGRRAKGSSTAQKSSPAKAQSSGKSSSQSEAPKFVPLPATTGGLGLFTVE